jgi:hypothetical protein
MSDRLHSDEWDQKVTMNGGLAMKAYRGRGCKATQINSTSVGG